MSPIAAFGAGIAAGALGALAQSVYFAATSKIAPSPPRDAFQPPELEQLNEPPTQTVARRAAVGLLQRDHLENKERAGQLVHYAFGSAWGGLYGLLAESSPLVASPIGSLGYGLAVWMIGDNVVLPTFRLGAWPQAYPPKVHAYSAAAHLVYGATLFGTFRALHARAWTPLLSLAAAAWVTRGAPKLVRGRARKLVSAGMRARVAAEDVVSTVGGSVL
jgi:uncharacterized membrane protein YagU involved in acid resistance